MYASALFEAGTIRRYLSYWKQLLWQMVAEECRAVEALEIVPAAEREQILEQWNATQAEYPRIGASTSCSRSRSSAPRPRSRFSTKIRR